MEEVQSLSEQYLLCSGNNKKKVDLKLSTIKTNGTAFVNSTDDILIYG